jgi:hypothetical protein
MQKCAQTYGERQYCNFEELNYLGGDQSRLNEGKSRSIQKKNKETRHLLDVTPAARVGIAYADRVILATEPRVLPWSFGCAKAAYCFLDDRASTWHYRTGRSDRGPPGMP